MPDPARPEPSIGRPRPTGPSQRFDGLSEAAIRAIATLLGAHMETEPYTDAGADDPPVYRLAWRAPTGTHQIIGWPSRARVDVRCGPHTWVAQGIVETEIIPGLEVVFRPREGGLLFIAVNGDVLMTNAGERGA